MKTILKMGASWCKPCSSLSDLLKSIDSPFPIREYDIDEDFGLAAKYKVRGVPTLILLDELGDEIARKTGMISKEEFLTFCSKGN